MNHVQIAHWTGSAEKLSWRLKTQDEIAREATGDIQNQVAAIQLTWWIMLGSKASRTNAQEIRDALFPDLDPFHPQLLNATDPKDLLGIVESTISLQSEALGKSIDRAFKATLELPVEDNADNSVLDDLAIAYTQRLAPRGFIEPYRTNLATRTNQFIPQRGYVTDPRRLTEIRHWATVLDDLASKNGHPPSTPNPTDVGWLGS